MGADMRLAAQLRGVGFVLLAHLKREHSHAACGLSLAQRIGELVHAGFRHNEVCRRCEAERRQRRLVLHLPLEKATCAWGGRVAGARPIVELGTGCAYYTTTLPSPLPRLRTPHGPLLGAAGRWEEPFGKRVKTDGKRVNRWEVWR